MPGIRALVLRSCSALGLLILNGGGVAAQIAADSPRGVVEPYDPAALVVREEKSSRDWPSWRRRMKAFHWYNLPDSSLAAAAPSVGVPGRLSARIDAWNGLAANRANNRLYTAANGGHGDYSGNEVCEIDLSLDRPRWKMLHEPTPREYIVRSISHDINDYYLDGRPASTHTYYALQFLSSRNAVFKFSAGSLWGDGGQANWKTDAFSLKNDDWHPADTWPDAVPGSHRNVTARAICADPDTDQVYVAAPRELRRFDPERGRYDVLARWPVSYPSSVRAQPCAVDTDRQTIIFFGSSRRHPNVGLLYDIRTNRFRDIQFRGDAVSNVLALRYNASWYDGRAGYFLLKTRKGGDLYSVDPLTFEVAPLETFGGENVPDAVNGVHNRWQWMPALGGYAYYPEYRSGIWFLATE